MTSQIWVIGRNLPFLTSPGIFGCPVIVKTIFRIEFRVYCEIFSLLGAIRVQKMTSERQHGSAEKDRFANYLPSLALSGGRAILKHIFEIKFLVCPEIFSLLGAIRDEKMTKNGGKSVALFRQKRQIFPIF